MGDDGIAGVCMYVSVCLYVMYYIVDDGSIKIHVADVCVCLCPHMYLCVCVSMFTCLVVCMWSICVCLYVHLKCSMNYLKYLLHVRTCIKPLLL